MDGLQEMIKTSEEFGKEHNITFSTDTDLRKCKTKCLAFLKKRRNIRNMSLGGNDLPWVESTKHLGNKITSVTRGMIQDVLEKKHHT